MDHSATSQPVTPDVYYSNLTNAATHAITDSLKHLRQSRIQGEHITNEPLLHLCEKLMRCYPRGGSICRPSFNLEFVDVTLDTSKKDIACILPYLLLSYIFNYSGNDTMHPKSPYNQPDFRIEDQKYPYSFDRVMMYEDIHPWTYTADGIPRDHHNYKRAIIRQAHQFTLLPRTKAQQKGFDSLAMHIKQLNNTGSQSEFAEIFWQVHIMSNILIWCSEEPSFHDKILYRDTMQLILDHFPFQRFDMINQLFLYAQMSNASNREQSLLAFSRHYVAAITPQTITALDLGDVSLSYISDAIRNVVLQDATQRLQMADST